MTLYLSLDAFKYELGVDPDATVDDARLNLSLTAMVTTISRAIDLYCRRHFYPRTETRAFNVPDDRDSAPGRWGWYGRPGRLYLDNDLISVDQLVGGDGEIASLYYTLYPLNQPIKSWIELNDEIYPHLRWSTQTPIQGVIQVTGTWGFVTDESQALVAQACRLWAAELRQKQQHPGVQSVSIGDFSTSFASASDQQLSTPNGDQLLTPPRSVTLLLNSLRRKDLAVSGRSERPSSYYDRHRLP